MRTLSRGLLLLVLLLATACSTASAPRTGNAPQRRDMHSLSRDEITQSHVSDAYELIRTLRPHWLRKRGPTSLTAQSDIRVYLDNVQLGGPDALRTIPISSIVAMQFLDAATATQRWGTDHVHGAIVVRTM